MKKYDTPTVVLNTFITKDIVTESLQSFTPSDDTGSSVYVGLGSFDFK